MTAKEVRDQVVTIFIAGHETTAQALSWTFYLLSQHPDVEGKLHDELATVLAGRTPRHVVFSELRYTRMVLLKLSTVCSTASLNSGRAVPCHLFGDR